MNRLKTVVVPGLLAAPAVLSLTLTDGAHGQVIYDSQGFEPASDYTVGFSLIGQDPDDNAEPDFQEGPWLADTDPSVSATVVSAGTVPGSLGDNIVQVTQTVAFDQGFFGVEKAPIQPTELTVSWRMYVEDSDPGDTGGVGPYFGVDVNDGNQNGDQAFPILVTASAGLDSSNGELITFDTNLNEERTGIFFNLGQWYDYEMVLDYASQTFDVFVDGVLQIDDQTFFDTGFGPSSALGAIDDYTDFSLSTFGLDDNAPGTFTPASATAYYDNVFVAIPEPTTSVILALGIAGMAGCRRRRSITA